jgi:glucosamine-6-phosphate deaminase
MKLPDGPDVHVCADRAGTANLMANDVVSVLCKTPPGQTILLATGVTMLEFYPKLISEARKKSLDLNRFTYGHLDNYVWRNGKGKEDFINYLHSNFLDPAGIPTDHFFPITGETDNPEQTAKDYEQWLQNQTIAAVFLGMGPIPEVHLAYMQAGTSLTQGVYYSTLSHSTITRNKRRGEDVPNEVITVGLADLRRATHKFVLAFEKEQEVRLALTGPITTDVVSTALRTEGFKESVHVYLDSASCKGLTVPAGQSQGFIFSHGNK